MHTRNRLTPRFIDKAQIRVHDRTIQGDEEALLQSRTLKNRTTHTQATVLSTTNKGRPENNDTTRPKTPKLHNNALRREDGAKRRRCRVRDGQGSSPRTLARRGEPRRRPQEVSGARKRRRRRRQSAEFSLGSSPVPRRGIQDHRDEHKPPDPGLGKAAANGRDRARATHHYTPCRPHDQEA